MIKFKRNTNMISRNIGTNASGAIWWPNLQLMQVAKKVELMQVVPFGGQICNYASGAI